MHSATTRHFETKIRMDDSTNASDEAVCLTVYATDALPSLVLRNQDHVDPIAASHCYLFPALHNIFDVRSNPVNRSAAGAGDADKSCNYNTK